MKTNKQKAYIFSCFIGGLFFVLLVRLYYLQVVQGDSYLAKSETNFIQERLVRHNRGKIMDANGVTLVDNRPSFDLYVTWAMLPDSLKHLRKLGAPLGLTLSFLKDFNQTILAAANEADDRWLVLAQDAPPEKCRRLSNLVRTDFIRGVQFDWENQPLTSSCRIRIGAKDFPSQGQVFRALQELLQISDQRMASLIESTLKKTQGLGRFKQILFVPDIGFDRFARIENAISLSQLAGVDVVPSKRRRYIHGDFATHALGYLNQVSLDDIQGFPGLYRPGDFMGRSGLEAQYEDLLRGQDGVERVIVDAKGRRFSETWERDLLGEGRQISPVAGKSIKLTLDYKLQKAAHNLFTEKAGSIVVMEAKTGFILAMASIPGFDPNTLMMPDNNELVRALEKDPLKPFRNKVIQDHYAPGSTIKPFTAIAALQKNLTNWEHQDYCSGNFRIHTILWRCFKREGHGPVDLDRALKVSCDNYFYELGYKMGLDSLTDFFKFMGLGQKTGIDLLRESNGIMPDRAYYKKKVGYVAPGFVVNLSIGQGDLSVTPLQLAVIYAALANGGQVVEPQLVKEIWDSYGQVIQKNEPKIRSDLSKSRIDFKRVLKGLSNVTDPGGSAQGLRYRPEYEDIRKWLQREDIKVGGKTGTAQVVQLSKSVKHVEASSVAYGLRDHGWFVGLFPALEPEIVVVVMTEHGGQGGSVSAPVAVRLMQVWNDNRLAQGQDQLPMDALGGLELER